MKQKKKILFTCLRMNVGGVEKAMISLMRALASYVDPQGRSGEELFDIHLALMAAEGDFMDHIPQGVTVHQIGGFARQQELWRPPIKGIVRHLLTLRWRSGLPAALRFAQSQITGSLFPYVKWLLKENRPGGRFANPDLDGEFDLAIDFPGLPGEYLGYYVGHRIKSRKRASWIHFDLDRVFIRPKSASAIYDEMDAIFCVSEQARQQFCSRWPDAASKTHLFHNIVDCERVIEMSQKPLETNVNAERINLVTVGRATPQKGLDLALRALRKLVDRGEHRIFWHFIGGGEKLAQYRRMASEMGLDPYCRFYGVVTNPYPFMRLADLYVQPSRYEGYGITIAEAKCFGMPIVATDFVGASEQLTGRSNALIIPNFGKEDDSEIRRLVQAIEHGLKMDKMPTEATHAGTVSSEMATFLSLLN